MPPRQAGARMQWACSLGLLDRTSTAVAHKLPSNCQQCCLLLPVSAVAVEQAGTCPDGQKSLRTVHVLGELNHVADALSTTAYPRWRIETLSSGGSAYLELIRGSPNGPVRFPRVLPLLAVLFPDRGPTRHGSAGTDLAPGFTQDQGGQGSGHFGCAVLAHRTLVC